MNGRELVIGVSGGVSAYKTAALVSQLVKRGTGVSVVMTESAGKFIGPATFEALTGRPVLCDLFNEPDHPLGVHIDLARQAELLLVAPATANFLAKAAAGIADDLLSTLYLSFSGIIVLAPAMNCDMWEKPAVQRNVRQLNQDGVRLIDPTEGWLSCRQTGTGRMAEPETIFDVLQQCLAGPGGAS